MVGRELNESQEEITPESLATALMEMAPAEGAPATDDKNETQADNDG
jgi:hypothetical protein